MKPAGRGSSPPEGPGDVGAWPDRLGRTVPLREAERELREAWRALDEESRRTRGEGMLRLREVNLIVACSENDLAASRRTAAHTTRAHPARVIIVVVDRDPADTGAEDGSSEQSGEHVSPRVAGPTASIATSCVVDESSGRHVCSEEVLVRGALGQGESAGASVVQLLVPEVPVVGWWVGEAAGHPAGLRWLAGLCDQMVTDLRRSADPFAGLRTLGGLVAARSGTGLRELEWLRSAHWRTLMAELFEQQAQRLLVPRLARLRVEHHRAPLQALLYGAWFGSRLGLSVGEGGWWSDGQGALCIELTTPALPQEGTAGRKADGRAGRGLPSRLVLEIGAGPGVEHEQPGLTATRVRSTRDSTDENEGEPAFTLRRPPDSCLCSAVLGPDGDELVVKSVYREDEDDHHYLSRVIDTPVQDLVLEEALLLAAALIERPGFDSGTLTGSDTRVDGEPAET